MSDLDFIFYDKTKNACDAYPPVKASFLDVVCKRHQMENHGRETFNVCAGMVDYKNTGWIIRAWERINIDFTNGVVTGFVGNNTKHEYLEKNKIMSELGPMDYKISDGITHDSDPNVTLTPVKIESPWSVYTEKDLSLLILPPFYHSNITNDFMIYPGIVDYSPNMPSLPIILAPKRKGKFTIEPGTPLYHIIPFEKKNYEAGYTRADEKEVEPDPRRGPGFYRKHLMRKSKYTMEDIDRK